MTDQQDLPEEEMEDFASLLEESLARTGARLEKGQKVACRVLQIGEEWVFLDVGQKGEGILDLREVREEDGAIRVAVGDHLDAYFIGGGASELRFTTRIGGSGSGTTELEAAWQSGIPVEGRIEQEIKGGYQVRLPGNVRAFCPFSQAGQPRGQEADELLEKELAFRIIQFGEEGRNIVVSHRAILEEQRAEQREKLRATLEVGQVVRGRVTQIRDFGAFVDIDGLEGLLPISEVAWGRVDDLHSHLEAGQELDVMVKGIDWEQNRFSFSLRDTLANPWSQVGTVYREGSQHTGTVVRLESYGAFVSLEEGVDGLLHISKLGEGRRLKHAKEVLSVGQQIAVRIEQIDSAAQRISLGPSNSDGEEEQSGYSDEPESGAMGTLGDLLKAKLK